MSFHATQRFFDAVIHSRVTANLAWLGNRYAPKQCTLKLSLALLTLSLLTSLASVSLLAVEKEIRLTPSSATGGVQHVQSVVQINGDLKLNADGKAVKRIPLRVSANLTYVEKLQVADEGLRQAVRHYDLAAAEMQLGKTPLRSELRRDRQLVGVLWGGVDRPVLFSPLGPLVQEELDLIDVQGNSVCLDQLAPTDAVQVGQSWEHAPKTLVALLNLDAVVSGDVQSKLVKVSGKVAHMDLAGKLTGVVGGATTEIELKGQWEFNLELGRTTRLVLSIREDRAIGHSEPGFEVTVRLRTVLRPAEATDESVQQLSDAALEGLELQASDANQLIELASPHAGMAFVHDRAWRVMADYPEGIVLRRVDGSDLVAQCNLTPLRKVTTGERLSLEQFQAEVERTIGDRLQQFVEASQSEEQGLRMLRVVATGVVSELPIRWIYYHVSNPEGHRASVVFTLEESLAEQFGSSDVSLAQSLRLADPVLPEGR
jgi:hypothetical protein